MKKINKLAGLSLAFAVALGGLACEKEFTPESDGFDSSGSTAGSDNTKALGDCEKLTATNLSSASYSDDTGEAISLIESANRNLCSIRVLYNQNNSKVAELEEALKKDDGAKVKALSDDLSLAINDGYVFAESAKGHISSALELDINDKWKEYLRLKESSLDMQIRGFKYRKQSAQLFRDKFGGADQLQMQQAKQTFKSNEESFNKFMKEAEKLNKKADEVAKNADEI